MTQFDVEIVGGPRDGELVYRATDWQHPPILQLDPPIILEPGQGLRAIATYDNWEDHPIGFGFRSTDEMMIVFGYYYLGIASEVSHDGHLPNDFELQQNYPNPFNPSTTISYTLPVASKVRLAVYDVTGRLVENLLDSKQDVGQHSISFDGSKLSSGIYFARLDAGKYSETKKMILLK
jgi:hypothetical protein